MFDRTSRLLASLLLTGICTTPLFAQGQPAAHSQPPRQGQGQGFGQGDRGFGAQGQAGQGQGAQGEGAQGQSGPSTDSFRFNQPIPVNIRRSNNAVMQAMLAGIDLKGITVITPQGRTMDFTNNAIRSIRSLDGSFFYNPGKDKAADVIAKLNQLQPANTNPGVGAGTGAAGGNAAGAAASTVPFTVTGQPAATTSGQPAGGHAQPNSSNFSSFGQGNTGGANAGTGAHAQPNSSHSGFSSFGQGNTGGAGTANAGAASSAQMMAHSQASSAHTQPAMPATAPTQTPFTTSHSQSSTPSAMPSMTPGASHSSSPASPSFGPSADQGGFMYQCSKCKHTFTSPTEIKAGHRCTSCGVVWGQVKDENGRVTSTSPAARIGGAAGIITAIVVGIAALIRKANAA